MLHSLEKIQESYYTPTSYLVPGAFSLVWERGGEKALGTRLPYLPIPATFLLFSSVPKVAIV